MSYKSNVQEFGDQVLAIATRIKNQFPEDWKNAHNHKASGEVYIRRVAHAVSAELPTLKCGLNLKRGNLGLSQDVLCFPNPTGARDATGQFAGLELRDIIASAGTPNASLSWGDVTQATIDKGDAGGWVKPEPVSGVPIPVPAPVPVPPPIAHKPYPGDAFFVELGKLLEADYVEAGQTFNAGVAVWFSRTIWRYVNEGVSIEQSTAQTRKELRQALGLAPLP